MFKTSIAPGHTLSKIYISSANDQHTSPSRHVQGNGKAIGHLPYKWGKMSEHYPSDTTVKAIVDAMQKEFENYTHRRENFGPSMKKKLGAAHSVSGHGDHIHFSVN